MRLALRELFKRPQVKLNESAKRSNVLPSPARLAKCLLGDQHKHRRHHQSFTFPAATTCAQLHFSDTQLGKNVGETIGWMFVVPGTNDDGKPLFGRPPTAIVESGPLTLLHRGTPRQHHKESYPSTQNY
jgi:hypothetical protein